LVQASAGTETTAAALRSELFADPLQDFRAR
jgi:hypothetical protein